MSQLERSIAVSNDIRLSLMSRLGTRDCLRLGATSKYLSMVVRDEWNLHSVLRRFVYGVDDLMEMIRKTRSVISGSVALQYLARVVYHESDLDIYSRDNFSTSALIEYITLAEGYTVYERPAAEEMEESGALRFRTDTLVRKSDGAKIQIMTTRRNVVDAVVTTFYTTAVVNIITGYAAYSMFPKATFVDARMYLLKEARSEREKRGIEKYSNRGFELCPVTTGIEELQVVRKLDDEYSWRMLHRREGVLGGGIENYRYVLGTKRMVKLNPTDSSFDSHYDLYVRHKAIVE